jgi:hypothetical protein
MLHEIGGSPHRGDGGARAGSAPLLLCSASGGVPCIEAGNKSQSIFREGNRAVFNKPSHFLFFMFFTTFFTSTNFIGRVVLNFLIQF